MFKRPQILLLLIALSVLLLPAANCRKKPQTPSPAVPTAPDEPIQKLAWESAQRTWSGLRNNGVGGDQLRTGSIENRANLPEPALDYFLHTLNHQLRMAGFQITDSSDRVISGVLTRSAEELIFSFHVSTAEAIQYSDSASVPDDSRLKNTLAQFEASWKHLHGKIEHQEREIPTPLLQLQAAPLDVHFMCTVPDVACEILLLYQDRLVVENWEDNKRREIPLSGFSAVRSRAPSGKIHADADGVTLMHNNLSGPLQLRSDLTIVPFTRRSLLPIPESGTNTFVLADGRFYDFDLAGDRILVAVDAKYNLNIAEHGNLAVSTQKVGGSVTVSLPVIYTSAFVPPGDADSVLKFQYQDGQVVYESSRQLDGEILDLTIADLNRDKKEELLVTLKTERGIFLEVYDPF